MLKEAYNEKKHLGERLDTLEQAFFEEGDAEPEIIEAEGGTVEEEEREHEPEQPDQGEHENKS